MKAVLYCRVSSREQQVEGYSIEAQQKLLRDYASKNSLTIVQEFVDVESAKNAGRTQFNAMLSYLRESPSVKVVLCEKTDRLTRNLRDYVALDDLDLDIHLVKEGEILNKDSKSHAKFIHGIKVLMAKNYCDNLSEEVKKGMFEKASQGIYPSMAPVGYLNTVRDGKKIIEVDPQFGPVVRKLFELYATGQYSLASLAKVAAEHSLLNKRSRKPCGKSFMEQILKHVIYRGDVPWNGKLFPGQHTPLVSRELFDAVQTALKRHNKQEGIKRDFAFAGLLTCGLCGCGITAELKKNRYVYYHCTSGKGKCSNSYVREEELDLKLAELVPAVSLPSEWAQEVKRALRESHADKKQYQADTLAQLRAKYDECRRKINQAYEDRVEGRISEEFWIQKNREWEEDRNRIHSQILRHEEADDSYMALGVDILELVETAPLRYPEFSLEKKRKILNVLLSNCALTHGNLSPVYRKPFIMLLEMSKSPAWLWRLDSN